MAQRCGWAVSRVCLPRRAPLQRLAEGGWVQGAGRGSRSRLVPLLRLGFLLQRGVGV